MNAMFALTIVLLLLGGVALCIGLADLDNLFGVVFPYAATVIFILGFVYRILVWAKSPVPFRITTTCGQQKSLPFIRHQVFEAPHNLWQTIGRMALEVFFFRSLFRNTRSELLSGGKVVYGPDKWLWASGLIFHWTFLIVVIRHFRFFLEPVPIWLTWMQDLDGFMQIGVPGLLVTGVALLGAVTFLFLRRVMVPQVKYISLVQDYFPLFLIMGIATTGIIMRYFGKVDIVGIKELAVSLVHFEPAVPAGLGMVFYMHLFLVCVLFAYFPFSKLMHMGGVFLSPTRNLANNSRARRHVNPWNPTVKTHTYEEYEDEFRDVMRDAGLPLDKDVPVEEPESEQPVENEDNVGE